MTLHDKVNIAYPIECEWSISPSASDLDVSVQEDGDCTVTALVVVPEELSSESAKEMKLVTKRVRLRFEWAGWVRLCPSFSDLETIEPGRFDFSEIPFHDESIPVTERNESTTSALHREANNAWIETGQCPDPGIYEIKNSTWLVESTAIKFGCKHFVIDGREMFVEILAQDLHFESLAC